MIICSSTCCFWRFLRQLSTSTSKWDIDIKLLERRFQRPRAHLLSPWIDVIMGIWRFATHGFWSLLWVGRSHGPLRFQGLNNTFFLFGYVSSSIYTPTLIIRCYIISQSGLLKYWFAMSFTLNLDIHVSTLFSHWFIISYYNIESMPIKYMVVIFVSVSRHCSSFCMRWNYELDGSLVNHWVSPINVLKSCMMYFNNDTRGG